MVALTVLHTLYIQQISHLTKDILRNPSEMQRESPFSLQWNPEIMPHGCAYTDFFQFNSQIEADGCAHTPQPSRAAGNQTSPIKIHPASPANHWKCKAFSSKTNILYDLNSSSNGGNSTGVLP